MVCNHYKQKNTYAGGIYTMGQYKGLIPKKYEDGRGNEFYVFVDPDPYKRENPGVGKRFKDVTLSYGFYKCTEMVSGPIGLTVPKTSYIDEEHGLVFDAPEDLKRISAYISSCATEEQTAIKAIQDNPDEHRKISQQFKDSAQKKLEDLYAHLAINAEARKAIKDLQRK